MSDKHIAPKAQYTPHPAPWSYEVHELSTGISAIVYDANGQRVGTDHLDEATAAKIAAAPDMYEALCDVRSALIALGVDAWSDAPHLLSKASAAIAKAEGE